MRLRYIISLVVILTSCGERRVDLDPVVRTIQAQYRGDVKATIHEKGAGHAYLLLELKDSLPPSNPQRNELAARLVKSAFYSMSDTLRNSIDLIRITFSNRSETYFQNEILISDLVKDDSVSQMEYCDILPDILSGNGLSISMDEIMEAEFYRLARDFHQTREPIAGYSHNDSLENVLKSNFHEKFKFADSCYSFVTDGDQVIKFCRRNDPDNDRSFEGYQLIGKFDEFFIFEVNRYEDWEFVIFDSNSGRAYSTGGYPSFSYSKKYMYSVTSYYGEAAISIHRLADDRKITFSFDNWDAMEHYWINEEGIRFKLRSTICRQGNRYIDCHFLN